MSWAVTVSGMLPDGSFSQISLGSVLSKGCMFSLLQPGEAQSATSLGSLWLTLKRISFPALGLVYSVVSMPKITLYTEADFESVSWE